MDERGSEERFVSGPWVGYWRQGVVQARQRLGLEFKGGRVSGSGRDPIGEFAIGGAYDAESGLVSISKRYASHTVEYDGSADGDGIGGVWAIRGMVAGVEERGEFRIWPDELAAGEGARAEAEREAPVER